MDGYLEREHIPTSSGRRARGEWRSATSQVREPQMQYQIAPEPDTPPVIDFAADAEIVRTVVEGERLTYGYLFNPAFATEISLIDPLPHQRIAVYHHMLHQSRLRFLLADDAGAGKTIMTGLYIREMLTRRLISRVLIVPPAGLVGNWERELHTLFNLPFRIITGNEARSGNPFIGARCDLLIASVDTLAGERMFARLQEDGVLPYDLVAFDEAHKLAANREADLRICKTDRYRLAEALACISGDDECWSLSWAAHHLLLLTATPHMGKDFPYYCLWRLLEPDALSTIAMQVVRAYEETLGAIVHDVSTVERALAAGLEVWPGFDPRSRRPSGDILAIEVKGRAGIGDVELTENEYIRACNLRDRYWLYVVYDCAKAAPRLLRIQDPFGKLIVRAKGSVIVGEGQIFAVTESE